MDTRRLYLLTRLPPLPGPGEPLPVTLSEALTLVRQQGAPDLDLLAATLEAEGGVREALDEWILGAPGSRRAPAGLPDAVRSLFDERRVAALAEDAWVDAVWLAWFGLLADVGRAIGSRLLFRWAAWEIALRLRLARSRGLGRGEPPEGIRDVGERDSGLDGILAAWDSVRERGSAGMELAAAMEAEQILERARLEYLRAGAHPYSFTLDELVSYLLSLLLLDRRRRLDPERGRAILTEVAAL